MTFRSRPVQTSRRRVRRNDARRMVYVTLTFSLAVVIAGALMGGVLFSGWYADHWAPVAAVNGETINKDAVTGRARLATASYERKIADLTVLRNQNQLSTTDYSNLVYALQSKEATATVFNFAVTSLENDAILDQYAAKNGISVTDQQIQEQIKHDATLDEMRHVQIIGIQSKPVPPSSVLTAADEEKALATATADRKAIIDGTKKWDDVVTETGSGKGYLTGTTGDLGLVSKDQLKVDPDLADAIFNLSAVNTYTDVFKGQDGTYRFATVTSITPSYYDADWQSSIEARAGHDAFMSNIRAETIQKAVQDSVEAKYISGPTVQRHVQEIAITAGYGSPGSGDEVLIREIIFAPGHDTANASTVPLTDPSWDEAKSRAEAAYEKLKADPSLFDSMARDSTVNDDQYWNAYGGEIPWIPKDVFQTVMANGSGGLGLEAIGNAVFADGLEPGTILAPIQEATQGWTVVEFEGRRHAPADRIADAQLFIASGISTWAQQVQTISETPDAVNGGDMGWVSPYQLDPVQQEAVFSTPVGQISQVVDDNGFYLYKILGEETRTPEQAQQARLKLLVYNRWFNELAGTALVWTDQTWLSAVASSSPSL